MNPYLINHPYGFTTKVAFQFMFAKTEIDVLVHSANRIRNLITASQPDASEMLNRDRHFLRPESTGCVQRIFK